MRGGIVDLFGLDRARPWRAEWFGDEVEDLRAFDVESQTSIAKLERGERVAGARARPARRDGRARARARWTALDVSLVPARRSARRGSATATSSPPGHTTTASTSSIRTCTGDPPTTLLDHAGDGALVLLAGGREAFLRAAQRHAEEIENLRTQEEERGELPPGARTGLLSPDALLAALDGHRCLELVRDTDGDVVLDWRGCRQLRRSDATRSAPARGWPPPSGASVLVVSRQQHRVEELVRDDGLDPVDVAEMDANLTALPPGALAVTGGDLSAGFATGDTGLVVYTDHELFGAVNGAAHRWRGALAVLNRPRRAALAGPLRAPPPTPPS